MWKKSILGTQDVLLELESMRSSRVLSPKLVLLYSWPKISISKKEDLAPQHHQGCEKGHLPKSENNWITKPCMFIQILNPTLLSINIIVFSMFIMLINKGLFKYLVIQFLPLLDPPPPCNTELSFAIPHPYDIPILGKNNCVITS